MAPAGGTRNPSERMLFLAPLPSSSSPPPPRSGVPGPAPAACSSRSVSPPNRSSPPGSSSPTSSCRKEKGDTDHNGIRQALGWSNGEVMRPKSKPCSRLMRHTAGIFSVGGALASWVLCRLHYGPRITIPRSVRWASCGAICTSSAAALLVRLFSPECEPRNIAAYDRPEHKPA